MAATFSEVDEIRRYMAQIRHELHQDVQGVVKGAEATADWRRYIRNYPWVTLGIAFGVGYLIVPRRQRTTPTLPQFIPQEYAKPVAEAVQTVVPEKKKGKGLVRGALGLIAPFALRTAQGYALQFFEQFLAQKMAQQQSPFADLAASFMPNGVGQPDGSPQAGPPRPPRG